MEYELRISKNWQSSKSDISLDIDLISWEKNGSGMKMSRGSGVNKKEAKCIVEKQQRLYGAYIKYATHDVEKFYQGGD